MSYLGSSAAPLPVAFAGVNGQSFNGGTNTFTLSRSVSKTTDIELVVNNVQQNPYDGSYSVSGNVLTTAEAVSAGVANVYVQYLDAPLGSFAPLDGSVLTASLAANAVTYAKMQSVTAGKVLGRDTSGAGVVQELPIAVDTSGNVTASGALKVQNTNANLNLVGASNVAGTTSFDLIQAVDSAAYIFNRANGPMIFGVNNATQARLEQSGDFRFNSGYGSVATAYGCRAWVNFNGTGTVAIRASGNVSSITDNGVGDYTANFTNAMPDANYSVANNAINSSSVDNNYQASLYRSTTALSTGAVRMITRNSNVYTYNIDCEYVVAAVFR
jgi:hypothetical protein